MTKKINEDLRARQQELGQIIKPIRKKISIEEMIKEQNYKPLERTDFFQKVDDLAIQESTEELISMLSK